MSRDFKVSALTAVLVIAVLAFVYPRWMLRDVPAITHNYNVELAGREAPELETIIRADPKFADVRVGARTGGNGALAVTGFVADEAEYSRLLKLVATRNLPVGIHWQVTVISHDEERPKIP